ncbi:MAG: DUF1405 domain-containing protein [Candidatus Nanoarchaeia archaeon]|nr:DUF1405 domain-containing protein [Candidatus Nanoarchaeia archaeon]
MDKELIVFLVAMNIVFAVYGFYLYYPQLIQTPFFLWIFVPDCPIAALLFAVLIIFRKEKNKWWTFFAMVTFTALIKYGVWTLSVYFEQPSYYFGGDNAGTIVFNMALHTVMILEAFLLIGVKKVRWWLASVLFLLQDVSDYFITLPFTPAPILNKNVISGITIFLSVALPVVYYKLAGSNKKIPIKHYGFLHKSKQI